LKFFASRDHVFISRSRLKAILFGSFRCRAITYELKDADVEHVVKEKERFRANPRNYALKKTQLMKDKDMAQSRGDVEEAARIGRQIQELEDRAEQLDSKRTETLQSIAYINERNRRKNVAEAERAIMEEAKANKGKKVRSVSRCHLFLRSDFNYYK
jgi:RNA polymerase-associated protein RTF1